MTGESRAAQGRMTHLIRAMLPADYSDVRRLWEATAGVGLNESDTEPAIRSYLGRNPEMSAVAESDGRIVGAVLGGHDGRRGYLHHLSVDTAYRRRGIGRSLVGWCTKRLVEAGITRCNIFIYKDNEAGSAFWFDAGWS